MITLLFDGDIIAYSIACAMEETVNWGDGVVTRWADADKGEQIVDKYIADMMINLDADSYMVAMSDKESGHPCFRFDIYADYKNNRSSELPMILPELRAHLYAEHDAFTRPMLEGDDVMGIVATHPHVTSRGIIVVSMDKDMKTVPGLRLLDPKTTGRMVADKEYKSWHEGVTTVTPDAANFNHMRQTLTGDVVDGYPGCPGIGPVKADRLLAKVREAGGTWDDVWAAVVNAYEKAGKTEDDALQMAQVAFILRWSHWDMKKQRPILWQPGDWS